MIGEAGYPLRIGGVEHKVDKYVQNWQHRCRTLFLTVCAHIGHYIGEIGGVGTRVLRVDKWECPIFLVLTSPGLGLKHRGFRNILDHLLTFLRMCGNCRTLLTLGYSPRESTVLSINHTFPTLRIVVFSHIPASLGGPGSGNSSCCPEVRKGSKRREYQHRDENINPGQE